MAVSAVTYENKDGAGIITVNNPPLNVLSRAVRDALMAPLKEASSASGTTAALDLITVGDPVAAAVATKAGVIDEAAEGEHLAAAIAFAKPKAGAGTHSKTRERNDKIEADRNAPAFNDKREEIKKRQPG